MLPFEFTIKGPPVSQQTRNRQRLRQWKQQVAQEAQRRVSANAIVTSDDVLVTITYYYETASPDVDNIVKPIQDALKGIVFVDDEQVVEARARKKLITGSYRIRGASSILLAAFADGDEFLHIKVEDALDPQEL